MESESGANTNNTWKTEVTLLLLAVGISIIQTALSGILLIFHAYLVSTGWTSWELLRKSQIWYLKGYEKTQSPFDMGICYNLKTVFCNRNIPKSWLLFRETPITDVSWTDEIEELPLAC